MLGILNLTKKGNSPTTQKRHFQQDTAHKGCVLSGKGLKGLMDLKSGDLGGWGTGLE
jgi:hypothetical protein